MPTKRKFARPGIGGGGLLGRPASSSEGRKLPLELIIHIVIRIVIGAGGVIGNSVPAVVTRSRV